MSRAPTPRLLVLLALLLPACGGGGQDRPVVVGTFPASGSTIEGTVLELEFVYDEPVAILNPHDVQVFANGGLLPTEAFQRPEEPRALLVRLIDPGPFPRGVTITARVAQGAVVNGAEHYADEVYFLDVTLVGESAVPVGAPGTVTMLGAESLVAESVHATPAGRDPVGLVGTIVGVSHRVWVQLDHGAGVGDALAFFNPGSPAAMTVVPLTTTGGLASSAPAITAGDRARSVYVAFRDTGSQRVRLAHVDTATGVEVDAIELASVPAGPATEPAGLELTAAEAGTIIVSAHDGATGTLAFVDVATFTEVDRDPDMAGTQGFTLPAGAGPVVSAYERLYVAPSGSTSITRVHASTLDASTFPGAGGGQTVGLVREHMALALYQALAGFGGTDGLGQRLSSSSFEPFDLVTLSDDVGGVSAGITDAIGVSTLSSGERFLQLFDSPSGVIAIRFAHAGVAVQEDLDPLTAGVQAADVDLEVPGATCMGETVGAYAP